ncbi:unnamed protein product [Brassica napus]|uniref:(rape) hypothetical protein n=1 Tax=Brassica napus TaxID=3708 RepID=A0A817B549_BRANA|nr:unnamed protein product [Brassica napus]
MSLDMLLLDEQSTLIHRSMNSSRVDTFRRRLSEGSVYSLSDIVGEVRSTITDVTRSSACNGDSAFGRVS